MINHILLYIMLLVVLQAEQKEIRRVNEENNQALTWRQTRNMPVSHKVRMVNYTVKSYISIIILCIY